MKLAPICLFTFNRPEHTARTLAALAANSLAGESDLHIFSDGPRTEADLQSVTHVRMTANNVSGFRRVFVREFDSNRGLATSITSGVSEVIAMHGRAIVLEDDIVTAPGFLQFMNQGLSLYEQDVRVGSISGYSFPLKGHLPESFFLPIVSSWGWATWKRAWNNFDADGVALLRRLRERGDINRFDCGGTYVFSSMLEDLVAGKNDSWAIRWYASCFLRGQLTLFPRDSLVQNIGHDGSGTHCDVSQSFSVELGSDSPAICRTAVAPSEEAVKALQDYFRSIRPNLSRRILARTILARTLGVFGIR